MPILLVLLLSVALSIALSTILLLVRRSRRKKESLSDLARVASRHNDRLRVFRRPNCWLAIKGKSLLAVQSALGMHKVKPCSWFQGLAGDEKLFIAPPVDGWILVMGSGLPDPSEDVDACFRFVVDVSRKLGQVHYFSASRVLHHHAWVKADGGRVLRAYAWAGQTLWQQGARTAAEKELDLKCFDYLETPERSFGQPDVASVNTDKVPMLAARWSLDPARIDERCLETERGIAGEPSRRY